MIVLEIMQTYHWTYQELFDQPLWIIDLIIEKMKIDGQKAKAESRKQPRNT